MDLILFLVGISLASYLIYRVTKSMVNRDKTQTSSSRLVGGGSRLVTPRSGINLGKTPTRTTSTTSKSSDDDDSLLTTVATVALINNLLDDSTSQVQPSTPTFEGGGGQFSGAGASGSWDPPAVDNTPVVDTSLTDSYSSFDSGNSGGGSDFS